MRRLARALIVGAITAGAVVAFAQSGDDMARELGSAAAGDADAQFADQSYGAVAFNMLSLFFKAIREGLDRFQNNAWAKQMGQQIALGLFLLTFIWGVIKSWLLGKGLSQLLGDFLQPLIMLGLVFFAIDANLGLIINQSIAVITTKFSLGDIKTPEQMIANLSEIAFSVFRLAPDSIPMLGDGVFVWVVGMLVRLASAILILISAAIAAGVYVLADITVALAIALGPILYSWSIWRPTEFLFTGWLKFLIVASFQKLMVVMLVALTGGIIDQVTTSLAPMLRNASTDFPAYGGILVIALLNAMIILKAPSLASGMISGAGSLDLSKWAVAANGAASIGKGTSAAAQGLGRAAMGTVKGGIAANAALKAYSQTQGGMMSKTGAAVSAARTSWKGKSNSDSKEKSTSGGETAKPPTNLSFPPIAPPQP